MLLVGWGTYLFFAVVNACFLPVIYFFYPETKQRSLEEIDIIFAKGYCEKISYVQAAKDLPFLSDEEVEGKALEYGLVDEISGNYGVQKGVMNQGGSKQEAIVAEENVEAGYGSGFKAE